jgi:hypothetical protein
MISFPNLVLVPSCLMVHDVLHCGPQARVVPVASPLYGIVHLDGRPRDVRMTSPRALCSLV